MTMYGEEVLGSRCLIYFENLEDGVALTPYGGRVHAYKAELGNDKNSVVRRHYVMIDDGDKLWFDLQVEEAHRRLAWISATPEPGVSIKRIKQENIETPQETQSEIEVVAVVKKPHHEVVKEKKRSTDVKAAPKKKKAKHTKAIPVAAVTPDRNRSPQSKTVQSSDDWIENMRTWLQTVPHGKKKSVVSLKNAQSVMRTVKKLESGQGITYCRWGPDVRCFANVRVNLENSDFDKMMEDARKFESIHGEDTGHGWLMRHAIRKLNIYQAYVREQME